MHGGSVKPGSITYGVRDVPPVSTVIPLVMQHVAMLSVELVFPVIVVTMAGGSVDMARDAVSLMMIAMGVGTILQALQKGPVGSGYFCAHETGTAYFPAVIATIQAGGVGLMSGMVLVSGLMQMLFSRLIHRLRILFPSEIIGLIIVMMAFSYISYGMTAFWGVGGAHHAAVTTTQEALFVGFFTLLVIVSLYIWGGKKMREYAILAGMVVGYASAWITGIIDSADLSRLAAAPVLTFPNLYGGWTFDLKFLPAFAVAALCSSIITIGNMSTCQKVNEVDWRRLDLKSAGNGLFAEGLATSVSGLLGALPQTTSPGSVGLSVATGVTSRYLGFVVGALLIVLSFFFRSQLFWQSCQTGDRSDFIGGNFVYFPGRNAGMHFKDVGFSQNVRIGFGACLWHGSGYCSGHKQNMAWLAGAVVQLAHRHGFADRYYPDVVISNRHCQPPDHRI